MGAGRVAGEGGSPLRSRSALVGGRALTSRNSPKAATIASGLQRLRRERRPAAARPFRQLPNSVLTVTSLGQRGYSRSHLRAGGPGLQSVLVGTRPSSLTQAVRAATTCSRVQWGRLARRAAHRGHRSLVTTVVPQSRQAPARR